MSENAKKTLLIILGRPPALMNQARANKFLTTFVENGGAVLYASDHDWPLDGAGFTRDLAALTGYRIDGTVLLASRDLDHPDRPTTFYRDPQCSVLRMIPKARPQAARFTAYGNGQPGATGGHESPLPSC